MDVDEDLVLMRQLAQSDDPAPLDMLMSRWQQRLFHYIVRIVGDEDLAEELTQETFFRLWRSRASFDPEKGRFVSWIYQIATRLCFDSKRASNRRPQTYSIDDTMIEFPTGTHLRADKVLYSKEVKQAVHQAMQELPANQRLALQMSRFEDMSHQEIAQVLDCSVGAVEQLIFRARKTLKEQLKPYL